MKQMRILSFMFVAFFFTATPLNAAWLLDTKKFQNSVHGDISCLECHESITDQDLHPNPEDVNKNLSVFFDQEQCNACHDTINEELENGTHGARSVKDPNEYENCITCHDPHYQTYIGETDAKSVSSDLSALSEDDAVCMSCHAEVDSNTTEGKEKIVKLCFHCHARSDEPAQKITGDILPLIHKERYASTPHADLSCTMCHLHATSFPHGKQKRGECLQCHFPHHEKITHAAHISVSCESCHLKDVHPIIDTDSTRILWKKDRNLKKPLSIHQMRLENDPSTCERCHFKGNDVGAATMVLPAKSILCMPCHAATFSIGDMTTIIALAIFALGMVMTFSYVLTGSMNEKPAAGSIQKFLILVGSGIRALFTGKIIPISKAVFLDVLLQRRLFRQSRVRWLIHSLIYIPFAIRFFWGIAALLASLWAPDWSPVWAMLDKNQPLTAFLFDLTGIMIILGIVLAAIRGKRAQSGGRPQGLPQQDRLALGLIVGIVVVGFILEGMRIAMTATPPGAAYAFTGYGLSILFSGHTALNQWYGYMWYLHAVLTGAFVAYLPFSRLLHIIIAPLALPLRAVSEQRH